MCPVTTAIGLRIDVDTMRGTRLGVPALLRLLQQHNIKATFFFSVGPDNMGRHLWRLIRPTFLLKMLRSSAVSLYGWDILLRGTFWPGQRIGKACADIIRQTAAEGHEIGLHAWDHHRWQMKIARMDQPAIHTELQKGKDALEQITGSPVFSSAVPGWRCTNTVLQEKEKFPFRYNSDCRGHSIYFPEVESKPLSQPQIPVTLPTYDELIGRNGINNNNFNEHLLSLIQPGELNVLTIHAEAEGISCLSLFEDFLRKAERRSLCFQPLQELLPTETTPEKHPMLQQEIEGRQGWVSCQAAD